MFAAVVEMVTIWRVVDDPATNEADAVLAVIPLGAPDTESASGPLNIPVTEPQES
jgi:hypothetical protein